MVRSLKKGPYIAYHLLKKILFSNKDNKKEVIKTWSRASTILPVMIGYNISLYNGKKHILITISESLVGHKLGEFVSTCSFKSYEKSDHKITKKD